MKEGGDTEEREAAVMEPGRCGAMKMRNEKGERSHSRRESKRWGEGG